VIIRSEIHGSPQSFHNHFQVGKLAQALEPTQERTREVVETCGFIGFIITGEIDGVLLSSSLVQIDGRAQVPKSSPERQSKVV